MTKKVLENIQLGKTRTAYIASVDGVLRNAGLWQEETWKLMGLTGMAFRFIIHDQICPSSVTVYDWVQDHFAFMDRIGIHSEFFQVYNDAKLNTFAKVQEVAINRIKTSIDQGMGIVIWAPTPILEFGIIKGYDDEDQVFFVEDCSGGECDPLLFSNLGKSDVPYLSYQIFLDRIEIDPEKVFRDSLDFAVQEWKKEFQINPAYGSGMTSYNKLIATLEKGDFNEFGLAYILMVYNDSKACIVRYLDFVNRESKEIKGLEQAVESYQKISQKYAKMAELIPFSLSTQVKIERAIIPEVLQLVKECQDLETKAMKIIEEALF